MTPWMLQPELAWVGLRAMKAAALADGQLAAQEKVFLDAAAAALGIRCDTATLPIILPEELAAAVPDKALRERIVQGMILITLMDERATRQEAAVIERYAQALGVNEPRVANLRQLAHGRLRTLWVDLARRSFARPIFAKTLRERGWRGVWKIVAPMIGIGQDPELAGRYRALGNLPAGTLGRAYFEFIARNQLGYPGEGIVAEQGVWHDLTHVLGGYGTDPDGEVQVVSFIAGYSREDPFFWLFTIALQFHLGIKVSPYSPALHGHFDPPRVAAALRRGLAMNRDLSADWDYRVDLPLPLHVVRRKYGVPPVEV